jgi:hypothetical protein
MRSGPTLSPCFDEIVGLGVAALKSKKQKLV